MELESLDHRLLASLQRDADLSNTALAGRIGLSPSACLRRVERLKKHGVIRRIVAVVDPARLAHGLSAIVTVEFARHGSVHRQEIMADRKSPPLTSSHSCALRMPPSA